MQIQALSKYVRMSPKKVREVARTLKGRPAKDALDLLGVIPRKSARLIAETLKSAIANAQNNHQIPTDKLIIENTVVEKGVAFRRFRPAARGSAHPYKKKTSHIRVTLVSKDESLSKEEAQ